MLTTYFLNCITEDIFRHQEDPHVPKDYYVGLSSTTPQMDGTGVTEPTADTGYARVNVDNTIENFDEADENGIVSNQLTVYFPESIKPWNGITHYVIYDLPEGGQLLMYGALNETMNVPIKTMVSIPVGTLKLSTENGVVD